MEISGNGLRFGFIFTCDYPVGGSNILAISIDCVVNYTPVIY
jgi:hypothetical protein